MSALLMASLKDRMNLRGGLSGGEAFANASVVQKLCDRSESAQMRLKLIFRLDKEHDEFHRRIIERIELDPLRRAAEGGDYFLDPIRGSVRDRNAVSDPGAQRFFPLFERRQDAVAIFRFDFALGDEEVGELNDGAPTLRRFHLGNDLLGRE